jgi:hypothetical protein
MNSIPGAGQSGKSMVDGTALQIRQLYGMMRQEIARRMIGLTIYTVIA